MKKWFIYFVIVGNVSVYSQNNILDWADYYYFNEEYQLAIEYYQKQTANLSISQKQKLARAFLAKGQKENARALFKQIVNDPFAIAEDYLIYSDLLPKDSKLAREYRVKARMLPIPFQSLWEEDSLLYKIRFKDSYEHPFESLTVNSENDEFAAVLLENSRLKQKELWFVTSRKMEGEKQKLKRIRSDYPIYNLAKASIDDKLELATPEVLDLGLNTILQDGPVSYDSDKQLLYITRSSETKTDTNIIHLDIYQISYPNSEKQIAVPLNINTKGYSTLHPTFDNKNQRLFFTSNRPGGYGGFDLYVAQRNPDGSFSQPINLGKDINTTANEVFPNWIGDHLSYASNNTEGIGGLDIWIAGEVMPNRWERNLLGPPFNTETDDFCWTFYDDKGIGFFTSNRSGGSGNDDLYKFKLQPYLKGVSDRYNYFTADTLIVSDLGVQLNDEKLLNQVDPLHQLFDRIYVLDSLPREHIKWNKNGSFLYYNQNTSVQRDSFYYSIRTKYGKSDPIKVSLNQKIRDLNKFSKDIQDAFAPIYFNYDMSNLLKQYKDRLDKVVEALVKYPKLKVRINSFTDSRGNSEYNFGLSERRQQTIINYIQDKLGQKGRIEGVAYGETKVPDNTLKNYYVDAGAYGDKQNAKAIQRKLAKMGYSPLVITTDQFLYRVIASTFESRKEAEVEIRRINKQFKLKLKIEISPVNQLPESFHRTQRRVEFEVLKF